RSAVPAGDAGAWIAERVATGLAAPELVVIRRIDGVGKKVNVREFLRSIGPSAAAAEALARAGVVGDLLPLAVEVDVRGSGGVKIAEVVEAVFDPELPHRAVRVALGKTRPDGSFASPLELE